MSWFRQWIVGAGASCMMLTATPSGAGAGEQFVVLHVSPEVSDIRSGAVFESEPGRPEFIFVPEGVSVALMAENGKRYVLKGLAGVAATEAGLQPYEIDREKTGEVGLLGRFLGLADDEETIAAGRVIGTRKESVDPEAGLALHLDVLPTLGGRAAHCIFSDTMHLARSAAGFSELVTIEHKRSRLTARFVSFDRTASIQDFRLEPNRRVSVVVSTTLVDREIDLVRLPVETLTKPVAEASADLAEAGCGLQAMMLIDSD